MEARKSFGQDRCTQIAGLNFVDILGKISQNNARGKWKNIFEINNQEFVMTSKTLLAAFVASAFLVGSSGAYAATDDFEHGGVSDDIGFDDGPGGIEAGDDNGVDDAPEAAENEAAEAAENEAEEAAEAAENEAKEAAEAAEVEAEAAEDAENEVEDAENEVEGPEGVEDEHAPEAPHFEND